MRPENPSLTYGAKSFLQDRFAARKERQQPFIPVFFGGPRYAIDIFIRYRVADGAVAFQLKMDRADQTEREAFGDILKSVEAATTLKALIGKAA